jgi:hypothetical protein
LWKYEEKTLASGPAGFFENHASFGLETLDFDHFATAISAAGRASDVRRNRGSTVGACAEDRSFPAVCAATHFLAAFRLTAFWYGHGGSKLSLIVETR